MSARDTQELNEEFRLHNSHFADPDTEQKEDQREGRKSRQSQRMGRLNQRTPSPPFDQSRLDHQLVVALRLEPSTNREFVPIGELNDLVTQESVHHELSKMEYFPTKIKHRTWRIATSVHIRSTSKHESAQAVEVGQVQSVPSQPTSYQKVFAILMLMGRTKRIWSFVKEGVSDADLPLAKVRRDGIFELRRCGNAQAHLRCLRKQSDIIGFVTRQWCVLAPVFGQPDGEKLLHCDADKSQIMPFVYWENASRQGGSGEVHKARIHPDHHAFDNSEASTIQSTLPPS
jgi:hypothetical protein